MKIGIITVQDSNNFGSFLQAYALQYILMNYGHEVFFIRSRSKKYIKRIFYQIYPPSIHDLFHIQHFITTNWKGWRKYSRFQTYQSCFRVIENYTKEKIDLVILGSDEIWNVKTPVFREKIFYGYNMAPVMTYAVSIGNATYGDMSCIPLNWFQHISPILVRDEYTSNFLKSLDITSQIVCDPTLLVDKKIYKKDYHNPVLNEKPFILIYSYGLDEKIVESIKVFAKKNDLRIISVCFEFGWCDYTIDCSPLDFCSILEKAAYVFTSTFHGTIFSILNHKSFVSLPQSRKTSDLLYELKLEGQLLDVNSFSLNLLQEKLLYNQIDYSKVDQIINNLRIHSLNILQRALKNYERN